MRTDVRLAEAAPDQPAEPRELPRRHKHVVAITPWAQRFGERQAGHPTRAGSVVGIAGYVAITGVLLGFGYLVTEVTAIGRWDASVNAMLVGARTPVINTLAQVGSHLGETLVVIAIAVVAGVVMGYRRLWAGVGLLAVGLLIGAASFLTTSSVIDRARPNVNPLDPAPVTGSYPSDHTAAAIVLYATLAMIVIARTRSAAIRAVAWVLAILLPAWVGVSQLILGMAHPTDVMAGLIGAYGCLVFAVVATQAAVAAEHGGRVSDVDR
jgi:membrane-associated phospholipid phosphatase